MTNRAQINPAHVGLPPRPFLYALDQIAQLTSIDFVHLKASFVFYEGRSIGVRPSKKLLARNIAGEAKPEWRVAEQELLRWLRACGFRIHERGWLRS